MPPAALRAASHQVISNLTVISSNRGKVDSLSYSALRPRITQGPQIICLINRYVSNEINQKIHVLKFFKLSIFLTVGMHVPMYTNN